MKCLLPLLLLTLAACQPASPSLWHHGQSDYVICLAPDASESEVKAAEVLQDYLAQAGGVELPIVRDSSDATHRIFLGSAFQRETLSEASVHY